jgi:hypothetical protein
MKHNSSLDRDTALLKFLHKLPQKIVRIHCHGLENIPEFVLHDFCHEACFNLSKAAYLVDSPDFNCCKGVAGISHHEKDFCADIHDIWQEPDRYTSFMSSSPFNGKVRSLAGESIKNGSERDMIEKIAHQLEFSDPEYITWPMKHDNHGILIFESKNNDCDDMKEYLEHGVYFLSLCPIH